MQSFIQPYNISTDSFEGIILAVAGTLIVGSFAGLRIKCLLNVYKI